MNYGRLMKEAGISFQNFAEQEELTESKACRRRFGRAGSLFRRRRSRLGNGRIAFQLKCRGRSHLIFEIKKIK